MRGVLARVRSFVRGALRLDRVDREMTEEMRFHIEMEADRLVRERRLTPAQARRQARLAFGSAEHYKHEGRSARGLSGITGLSLNVKLGARLLAKYPGVTIVGGLAMAIGVGLGAAYLEVVNDFLHPTLPVPEGHRIVGLQNWDVEEIDPEPRSMRDFAVWRAELRSVEHLAAFRSIERNLGPIGGALEPTAGAEITPSGFAAVRVPALLGRTLVDADERDDGAAVVVLGYHVWRNRFSSDPGVIGREIQTGSTRSTVVGVMPEGFAFPVSHAFWVPLRANGLTFGPREGPAVLMFGRLAPGVTLDEAQAELSAIGARAAADLPKTHARLRPRVMKYARLFAGNEGSTAAYLAQFVFVLILLVLSSNVATMVFARTATREHEIAMRFALGASRGQILAQFFVEALVLALAATAAGLVVVAWGADWVTRLVWDVTENRMPFWLESGRRLNATTILYAVALAIVGSLVAGVLPALKATGPRLQGRLRHGGTGDSSLRLGGIWTALIVVQVAFAVLVVPPAIVALSALGEPDHAAPGFAADQYVAARLEMDLEQPIARGASRQDLFGEFQATRDELRRRLLETPGISRVTFASRLPGMGHPELGVDLDEGNGAITQADGLVMAAAVDVDYFDALDAPLVAGRTFMAADRDHAARVVIVNEAFVRDVLGGRSAVGRRIRYQTRYGELAATGQPRGLPRARMLERSDWFEIVGVSRDLGMDTTKDAFRSGRGPGVYHPLTAHAMGAGGSYAVSMAMHVREDPVSFAPRLRDVARGLHPALRLYEIVPMDGPVDNDSRTERLIGRFFSWLTALVAFLALLISVAGTYSVLSFTVSRQTREIGIRIALGADRRRIIAGVFSRAMVQIGAGLVIGMLTWFYVIVSQFGGGRTVLLALTAAALILLGLVACAVPVRRALRIEPTEALREV